jgi:2-isopropylmalate synthase
VTVQVEHENVLYRGRGVSTDSVEASAKAFLNAINRIVAVGNGKKEPANL